VQVGNIHPQQGVLWAQQQLRYTYRPSLPATKPSPPSSSSSSSTTTPPPPSSTAAPMGVGTSCEATQTLVPRSIPSTAIPALASSLPPLPTHLHTTAFAPAVEHAAAAAAAKEQQQQHLAAMLQVARQALQVPKGSSVATRIPLTNTATATATTTAAAQMPTPTPQQKTTLAKKGATAVTVAVVPPATLSQPLHTVCAHTHLHLHLVFFFLSKSISLY